MASNGDEVDDNDNTRSVNFGATIEDDDPFAGHASARPREGGGGAPASRRMSLTKSKKFREARSMRFSELNQVTGAVSSFRLIKMSICIVPIGIMQYSDILLVVATLAADNIDLNMHKTPNIMIYNIFSSLST